MFKIRVPTKVRVRFKSDLHKLIKIRLILQTNGFEIAKFGSAGIAFYKLEDRINQEVPVNRFYFLAHKEFALLIQILAQLKKSVDRTQINRLGYPV